MHKIITELNNRIKQTGATRVVIDPVGPLIFSGESVARVQDQARMLFYALKNHAATTTLVTKIMRQQPPWSPLIPPVATCGESRSIWSPGRLFWSWSWPAAASFVP